MLFAGLRAEKLENLHLAQTKCKSHFVCLNFFFAHMQIWSCEQKAKFAHVSIYLIVLNKC